MTSIILTAIATLIVTIIASLALDYFKNIKPKISYRIREALPIEIDDKKVGAYLISVINISKKTIKDLSIHVEADSASLKNGGISTPQGLIYDIINEDNKIKIDIPFFTGNEEISFTIIAESPYFVPNHPQVAIRSPQQFKLIKIDESTKPKKLLSLWITPIVASLTATTMAISFLSFDIIPRSQKDIMTFSANIAELPELVKLYAVSNDLKYYNQGDLIFSLARQSKNKIKILKYKTFLETTISLPKRMATGSKSNLLYNLAKIYLLLNQKDLAIKYFKEAIEESKGHVIDIIKYDFKSKKFIDKYNLLSKE